MYVCMILLNPVKPELGIIPIKTNKKIFKNRMLNLNITGKELIFKKKIKQLN